MESSAVARGPHGAQPDAELSAGRGAVLAAILDATRDGTGHATVLRAGPGRGRSTALWRLRAEWRRVAPTAAVLWCSGTERCEVTRRRVDELLHLGPVLVLVDDAHRLEPDSAAELGHLAARASGCRLGVVLTAPSGAPLHPELERLPETPLPDPGEPEARALLAGRAAATPPAVLAELLALCAAHPLVLRELLPVLSEAQLGGTAPLPRRPTLGPGSMRLFGEPCARLPDRARRWLLLLALGNDKLVTCLHAASRLGLTPEDLAPAELAGIVRTDGAAGVSWGSPLYPVAVAQSATLADTTRTYRALAEVSNAHAEPVEHPRWLAGAAVDPTADRPALTEAIVALASDGQLLDGYELARRAELVTTEAMERQRYRVLAAGLSWLAGYGEHSLELLDQLPSPLPSVEVQASVVVLRCVIQGLRDSWPAGADLSELGRPALGRDELGRVEAGETEPDNAGQATRSLATALLVGWETLPAESMAGTLDALRELFTRHPEPRPGMTSALAKVVAGDTDLVATERAALLAMSWWLHPDDVLHPKAWPPPLLPVYLGDESGYARHYAELLLTRHVRAARATRALLLVKLATVQAALGHWPHALRNAASSRELAEEMGLWALHTEALTMAAWIFAARGAEDSCLDMIARAHRQEGRRPAGAQPKMVQWTLGLLGLSMGRPAEAHERLRPLHRDPVESPLHLAVRRLSTADFVEASVAARQPADAADAVAELAAWVEVGAPGWARLDLARCRALLGEARAEQWHLEALEQAGAVGRLATTARAELSFGSWLRRRKRYQEARPHLRLAQHYFDRLDAPPWRDRAHAELRAAGEIGPSGRAADEAGPGAAGVALTAQEWQIARLAAEGRSNREIGDRLALSPRTVGYHLYKIFPKLDITTRTQLPLALRNLGDQP
ncbi:MAG TPA: helix-turn-helix transcriptional regulator [Pseudonocardia sp.]|nr:helix-turn-helix transcriptional regulator [Pseudonocardia sp.]